MNISSTLSKCDARKYLDITESLACNLSNSEIKIGSLILTRKTYIILTTGYDKIIQSSSIIPTTSKVNYYTVHAIENIITNVSKIGGISLNDTICVITRLPCFNCIKLLIESGVTCIVTKNINVYTYSHTESILLLEESGVEVIFI